MTIYRSAMTYCVCGHADIVHVDHFLYGRQECAVNACSCDQFEAVLR